MKTQEKSVGEGRKLGKLRSAIESRNRQLQKEKSVISKRRIANSEGDNVIRTFDRHPSFCEALKIGGLLRPRQRCGWRGEASGKGRGHKEKRGRQSEAHN